MGVSDLSANSYIFSIYPNPTSDFITIGTSSIPTNGQLSILTPNGKEIISQHVSGVKPVIDISKLSSGVYFVRLTNDKTVEVGKFIKQ